LMIEMIMNVVMLISCGAGALARVVLIFPVVSPSC
jgi:hypothetical protein